MICLPQEAMTQYKWLVKTILQHSTSVENDEGNTN